MPAKQQNRRRAIKGSGAPIRARSLAGAVGGIVGTVVMTAAMRRLHRDLPAAERYPLPPREIVDRTFAPEKENASEDLTLLTHLAFGAAAGSLAAAMRPLGPLAGSGWGVLVWTASYFGWVPFSGILKPACAHPMRRNALMLLVHVVWGSATALSTKELLAARRSIFAAGPTRDGP